VGPSLDLVRRASSVITPHFIATSEGSCNGYEQDGNHHQEYDHFLLHCFGPFFNGIQMGVFQDIRRNQDKKDMVNV